MTSLGGTWKHYKGHVYELLGVAKHSETVQVLGLAYKRVDTEEVTVWVRPESMWGESVDLPDGRTVARFELLSRESSKDALRRENDELKLRVADLERQLHEPGYTDALRAACEKASAVVPKWFREKYAAEGDSYDQLEALPHLLARYTSDLLNWSEDDDGLPEDTEIHAAHPAESNSHDTYMEAFRMVGAKRSKFALVDLVNWLLVRLKASEGSKNGR